MAICESCKSELTGNQERWCATKCKNRYNALARQKGQELLKLSGSALRDQGQQIAIDHTESQSPRWTENTLAALHEFCDKLKSEGTHTLMLEDFRATRYKDPPASPNMWGAFARIAANRGVLKFTGEFRQAKSAKTHAHPVRIWAIV